MPIPLKLVRTTCCVALLAPAAMFAQQDTTRARQDSIRRQDSVRTDAMRRDNMRLDNMRQDSLRRVRNSSAQSARVTSDYRIPVSKESDADQRNDTALAEQMRRDSLETAAQRERDSLATIERARTDSISRVNQMRADSIAADQMRRRDSIALADERARQEQDRYRFGNRGWYVGIGAGTAIPRGDLKRLGYNNGWGLHVPIGWHPPTSVLGWRVDLSYNQFASEDYSGTGPNGPVTLTNEGPRVFSAALNGTLRAPLTRNGSVGMYALGGGGLYHFRNYGQRSSLSALLGDDVLSTGNTNFSESRTKFGVQGGVGLDIGSGPVALYVESRFVQVFAGREGENNFGDFFRGDLSTNLRWIPIVVGVKIR